MPRGKYVDNIQAYLPEEPNSFVGREHELAELRKLVSVTRLLTLSGPGGIGKTRLALRVLAVMAQEFPDGACYVELADLDSPDLVLTRVASAIGVSQERDRPLLDTLSDALRTRRLLLALDNCEHLLDSCAKLCKRLLASSPELRVVVTSREPLRVAGETVWPVPPLAVTPAGFGDARVDQGEDLVAAGGTRAHGVLLGRGPSGGPVMPNGAPVP